MKRKILLRQTQSPGDIIVMTGAVRDLKKNYPDYDIYVDTTCNSIWENNPNVTIFNSAIHTEKMETFYVDYNDIHNSGKSGRHFSQAFNISISEKLKIKFPQTEIWPDLYLSEEEKSWTNQIEDYFGYKGPFWLINSGYKMDFPLKDWGHDNYQKLVDLLSDKVQFVQIGELSNDHVHIPLNGVLQLIGKTDLRQFIRLAYYANGSVGPVSMHMHTMAAFKKPCVVIGGGREPWRWESYPNHRYLSVNGQLECCKYDGCWKNYQSIDMVPQIKRENEDWRNQLCRNMAGGIAKCMAMIKPEDVARDVLRYIEGGMA